MKPNYSTAYQQLNPAQRQAVDTIEGPVMVMAGPGTGKTQVLATRIANILMQTDVLPTNILALTFTDAAAKNMRDRVVQLVGIAGYRIPIMTFHSFCNDVIQDFSEFFPLARGAQILSELEKVTFLKDLIISLDLEVLKPLNKVDHYLRDIGKAISDLKKEGVDPDQFSTILETAWQVHDSTTKKSERLQIEKNRKKNQELATIYQAYQQKLQQSERYDFDDMVAMVVTAFKTNELVRLQYQEKYLYVLIDEYQDTNSAQNQVVDLLMSYWEDQPNLFVVGDPQQSIYRFQGASLANTISFVKRYPQAQQIVLTKGYRCSQTIYDVAHALLLQAENVDNTHALESVSKTQQTIKIVQATSQISEYLWIIQEIEQLLKSGKKPEEIAVLFRTNQEILAFEALVCQRDIPYLSEAGEDSLSVLPVQQFILLCQLLVEIKTGVEHPDLFSVLSFEWFGLPYVSLLKLARMAHARKTSLLDLLLNEKIPDASIPEDVLTVEEWQLLRSTCLQMISWIERDANVTFTEWVELVLRESGLLDWVLKQPQKVEYLLAINSVFGEIKSQVKLKHTYNLADFVQTIALLQQYSIKLLRPALALQTNAVRLSTAHKAKGQEWDTVFVAGLIDGKWGNSKNRRLLPLPQEIVPNSLVSDTETNAEERRLLYVAITRAKTQVYLSYSDSVVDQSRSKATNQSEFLAALLEKTPKYFDTSMSTDSLPDIELQLEQLLLPTTKLPKLRTLEKDYLQSLVARFSLSVSSLNKYLRDPENFLLDVLLRIPKAKDPVMAFGSAVHAALEDFYKQSLRKKVFASLPDLLSAFDTALNREVIHPNELERRRKYGHEILTGYYNHLDQNLNSVFSLETMFGYGEHPTYLDDIHLTGRIDRVDFLDSRRTLARVVDYKTGKPKSRNAILGISSTSRYSPRELALPPSIRGEYTRQLLFYKLLTDLSPKFSATVTEGVFEFIEPNASGTLVHHHYELQPEHVEDLKALIREVMTEIRSLSFLS